MRKVLLLLAACGLLPAAQAQTERGSKLLGVSVGELRYARGKFSGASYLGAALTPTAAIFVADNLALGAGLSVAYARQRYNDDWFFRQFGYGLAPVLRYYVPGGGRHRVFGELGGEYGRRHSRGTEYRDVIGPPPPERVRRTSVYGYHAALGYSFFLAPTAALEATAGYYRVAHDPIYHPRNIFDVRVGFSVYLPGKGTGQN